MNDLKSIIASNISALRSANKMTQLTLAEKLCYSDKAISKWERGESVPDISVLKQIADLFGVTVDYLITDHSGQSAPAIADRDDPIKKRSISLFSIYIISLSGVWFLGILAYTLITLLSLPLAWVSFIACIPVSSVLLLIFNCIWGKRGGRRPVNYGALSVLIWSLLLLVFVFLPVWQLFLLGIPAQVALTFAMLITGKSIKAKDENAIADPRTDKED